MARKPRIDSVQEISRIMQGAGKEILPPDCVPLDEDDLPFFNAVIAEFARAEWTEHSLHLAANLARMMADLTSEQMALRQEGVVSESLKGTPVINPRKTAVQMYASTILAMRRSLALHSRAQSGTNDKAGKRKGIGKAAEDDASDDDLIGKPQ